MFTNPTYLTRPQANSGNVPLCPNWWRGGARAQGPRSCRPLDLARIRWRARW